MIGEGASARRVAKAASLPVLSVFVDNELVGSPARATWCDNDAMMK